MGVPVKHHRRLVLRLVATRKYCEDELRIQCAGVNLLVRDYLRNYVERAEPTFV